MAPSKMPLQRDRAPSPERMFAKVWEDDGVDYPIAETPAPSTPPTPTFSGLLIDIDDQPLPPAAQLPTSIFTSALVTTSSDNASQATTTFTARGPALNPTRAPFTPSNASTTRPQGAAQNGSPQPPRRGVSNGTPNNTGSPSAFQRQNGPTNTSPQRRPSGLAAPRHRHESEPRLPPGKAHFPKGPGLETTRQALTLQSKKEKEEKEKILLGAPSDSEVFAAEGIYLWPDKAHPTELLGLQLEDLNHIRFQYNVRIAWKEDLKSLVVMAARGPKPLQNVRDALAAVRQDYENARARSNLAAPLYVAIPPSVDTISTIVKPEKYGTGMIMIELQGERYSGGRNLAWGKERDKILRDGHNEIKAHLLKNLRALAPVKGWMRMRVNFGHLNITNYPPEFSQGKYDFKGFLEKVLKHPRAQASATFERKLPNPLCALKFKSGIEKMPEFCSKFGVAWSKDTVIFRESLCLFFETAQGIPLRIEMDLDYNEIGGYQPGVIKCFRNNRRNKHLEILSCDPEKQIDWSLELITDNMIKDPEPEWESYISKCIGNGDARYDSLGLHYPALCLRYDSKIRVTTAVVRSKISYMLAKSGHHVDLTIYREWYGTNSQPNATLEPVIKGGVSMYHPQWDNEMLSIEETTIQRQWDDQLSQLFDTGPKERPGHVIDHFLEEVDYVADLLSTVCYEDFKSAI